MLQLHIYIGKGGVTALIKRDQAVVREQAAKGHESSDAEHHA
jgi:hypothetical protein